MHSTQKDNTMSEEKKIALRRGIFLSWLWGMGLKEEHLECSDIEIIYDGIAKRFAIWRWTRVNTVIKLNDVRGITDMKVSYPILWMPAIISLVNLIANITNSELWWSLQIWKIPYLWFGTSVIELFASKQQIWVYIHALSFCVWAFLAISICKRVLLIDVGPISTLRFNTRGLTNLTVSEFKKAMHDRWSACKKGQPSQAQ